MIDGSDFGEVLWPDGLQRHFTGRFTGKIADYIAQNKPIKVTTKTGPKRTLYVVVDAIELGDNPAIEELEIRFRVLNEPPPREHVTKWESFSEAEEVSTNPLPAGATRAQGVQQTPVIALEPVVPVYFFTFSNEIPLNENIADFEKFVLDNASVPRPLPVPDP